MSKEKEKILIDTDSKAWSDFITGKTPIDEKVRKEYRQYMIDSISKKLESFNLYELEEEYDVFSE